MKVISTGLLLAVVAAASANNALSRRDKHTTTLCGLMTLGMKCSTASKAECTGNCLWQDGDDECGMNEAVVMGPMMASMMQALGGAQMCAFINMVKPDEREAGCKKVPGCKFSEGACAFDAEAAKKSNPDPALRSLMVKAAECSAIKDQTACKDGCAGVTNAKGTKECGFDESQLMPMVMKQCMGGGKPEGGGGGAKGDVCKGINAMMDAELVCAGADEKGCGAKKAACKFEKRESKSRRDKHLKGEQGEAGEAGEAGAAGENYNGQCEATEAAQMKDMSMADMLAVMQAIKPTEKCDQANEDSRLRRDKHITSDADREKKCKAAHAICGWEDDYDNLKKDGTFGKHCNAEGKKTVALVGCDGKLAAKYYRWMAKKAQANGKRFAEKAKQAKGKVAAVKRKVAALKARKAKCAAGGRDRREEFGVKSNSTKAPQTKVDDCSADGKAALDKEVSAAEAVLATEEKAISAFTKAEGAQKATEATLDKDAAAKDAESSATGLASCLATVLAAAVMAVAF